MLSCIAHSALTFAINCWSHCVQRSCCTVCLTSPKQITVCRSSVSHPQSQNSNKSCHCHHFWVLPSWHCTVCILVLYLAAVWLKMHNHGLCWQLYVIGQWWNQDDNNPQQSASVHTINNCHVKIHSALWHCHPTQSIADTNSANRNTTWNGRWWVTRLVSLEAFWQCPISMSLDSRWVSALSLTSHSVECRRDMHVGIHISALHTVHNDQWCLQMD